MERMSDKWLASMEIFQDVNAEHREDRTNGLFTLTLRWGRLSDGNTSHFLVRWSGCEKLYLSVGFSEHHEHYFQLVLYRSGGVLCATTCNFNT